MIQLEVNNSVSIVRIHDDYCQQATEQQFTSIDQIVSDSYQRRQQELFQEAAQ